MFDTSNSLRPTIHKAPSAVLDYSFDFTDWLEGESITGADGEIESPMTIQAGPQIANGVVTFRVAGGEIGRVHSLTCHVSTATKKDARSMYFRIVKR